jgi:hypothetical protein
MEKRFFDSIDDRIVLDVYKYVKHQLELMPPNGAIIHKKSNYLCMIVHGISTHERDQNLQEETFSQFRARDPEKYHWKVGRLYSMVSEFGLHV